ncbi:glyoxalase superfamily protein [Devosia sp. 2618]|uniref:glyoxalase superfamily protein n=1 Tax=Devosia sp. 2618 TaxID=3156454 RepID=UPI003391C8AC
MAKALRHSLPARGIALSHSDCLELVARQFGFANWNMLAARIQAASQPQFAMPAGWFVSHPSPTHYRIGLDPRESGVALVAAVPNVEIPADRTGVLMQSIDADAYCGRAVRLTAQLRTEDAGAASIWMRIDPNSGRYLRFDNMLNRSGPDRSLHGTVGWTDVEVVLDVPDAAASIHFGLLLVEQGTLRARGIKFEKLGGDFPVTATLPFLPRPTNLGFLAAGFDS